MDQQMTVENVNASADLCAEDLEGVRRLRAVVVRLRYGQQQRPLRGQLRSADL